MSQPQETRGLEGSFQIAIMGSSAIPLDIPVEKSPEEAQPQKPAVEKPKATQKTSKPKKKKVKKAKVRKTKVKKAPAKKPVEEEDPFLTKTFKQLVGDDDDKKGTASKSQLQKTAGKKPGPEKKEEGLLTKTLKTLVGGDKKEEQTAKKNTLNPINMAPTGSAKQKKSEKTPKTAKSETKATLKDSFEKLIGVGAVNDDGDSQSAKTDKPAGKTKSAKQEKSGGLLDGILGSSEKKKDSSATKQAKAKDTVKKTPAPAKPRKFTARKYPGDEEEQLDADRGGVKKGKNVLKESFKTLVTDDKKKEEEE